jgi:cytochrome P450
MKQIKSEFYQNFGVVNGHQMILGKLDTKAHDTTWLARKNLVTIFSSQNLFDMGEVMRGHLHIFTEWLKQFSRSQTPINVYHWFRMLTLDIVADVAFGGEFHQVERGDDVLARTIDGATSYGFFKSQIPFLGRMIDILPLQSWKEWKVAEKRLINYCRQALVDYNAGSTVAHKRNVLTKLKEHNKAHPDEAIGEEHLITLLAEVITAGSDTTATTATYVAFELAMNPDIQGKVRRELIEAFPDPDQIDLVKLLKLPYLDAVIKETMRLFPVVPVIEIVFQSDLLGAS